MLIVIEGTDGAGKTTLADGIQAELQKTRHRKIIRRHYGPPECSHPLIEYERWLDFYRPGRGVHVIIDRFHWGEMIYGDLYRGGSQLGQAGFWHIEQYLRSRGACMVYACGNELELAERQAAKNEDFLQPEDSTDVLRRFDKIAENSIQGVANYNTSRVSIEEGVDDAITLGAVAEMTLTPLRDFPSYIGPNNPDLLLVGDRPGNSPYDPPNEAAFAPYPATSGLYLIESLLGQSLCSQVGITNAYHHGVIPISLKKMWSALGCPEVCALGREASHHLSVLGVEHRQAPHPQWQRRFRWEERQEYAKLVLGDHA